MLAKSRLDQHIGDKSGVGKLVPSHWGQAAALQPVLNGSLLIGVPICSDHWLHHHHLSHYNFFARMESISAPSCEHTFWSVAACWAHPLLFWRGSNTGL